MGQSLWLGVIRFREGRMTLLEVLAAAEAGGRLLDARVARAVRLRVDLVGGEPTVFMPNGGRSPCPAFTLSMDAALSALPREWFWAYDAEAREARIWRRWPGGQVEEFRARASSAPLALCAAVLLGLERAARPIRPNPAKPPSVTG